MSSRAKTKRPKSRLYLDRPTTRADVLKELLTIGNVLKHVGTRQWLIGDESCPFFFVLRRKRDSEVVTLQILGAETGAVLLPDVPHTSIGFLPHQHAIFRKAFHR